MTDIQKENKSGDKVPNNPKQIPNLRFPEFEGEWEVKKLGEIATFSKGKGISKSEIEENENVIYSTFSSIRLYWRNQYT